MASLAKRFEEVYVPGRPEPIRIPRQSEALYLLQRIRDEAHRFAITYHRELRGKRMTTSVLDGIPGLGETRRKRRLVKELGGVQGVKAASLEELQALPWLPDTVADAVHEKLHGGGDLRADQPMIRPQAAMRGSPSQMTTGGITMPARNVAATSRGSVPVPPSASARSSARRSSRTRRRARTPGWPRGSGRRWWRRPRTRAAARRRTGQGPPHERRIREWAETARSHPAPKSEKITAAQFSKNDRRKYPIPLERT